MDNIKPVKKSHILIAWTGIIVCLFTFSLYIVFKVRTTKNDLMIQDMNKRIEIVEIVQQEMKSQMNVSRLEKLEVMQVPEESVNVLFTNYGQWDGESADITASGLTSNDFEINEYGFYTYQGKVVLGSANSARLDWPLLPGYKSHDLFTELTIEVLDQKFEAIVLDVCGACYGVENETSQRYDIYTTNNHIGKVFGEVYE